MPPLIDAYLRQAVPLIQTYNKDIHKLAKQNLMIYRNNAEIHMSFRIQIEIPVQIVFVPALVQPPANETVRQSVGEDKSLKDFRGFLNLMEVVLLYNTKLKDVVLQALLVEKELQDGNSTLTRKVNKLSSLKDGIEAFSEVLEKVHACYSAKSLGLLSEVDLPSIEEIKQAKNVIHTLKTKLALDELSTWINNYCGDGFKTTDDAIVCTILGLSEGISAWLSELDPLMRTHQPFLYFVKKAIDAATEEKLGDNTMQGKPYLLKSLQSLGFTLYTAATICQNIPDDTVELQTPAFWAKRYLDYAYTYHPLLKTCPRYPYCADIIDECFKVDITQQCSGEDAEKPAKVRIINLSNDSIGKTPVLADLAKLLEPEDGYQLLFHGTTHDSAVSIITDGIILTRGEKNQDFSSGDGFYLSEDFENACLWRRAGRGKQQAVIVYKIKQDLLDVKEQNGLDLAQNKRQWEEVVLCCRSGYKDKKYKKRLNGITFIRGPLCRNPQKLGGHDRPIGFGRDDMQLCIRDEDYAETFGKLENIGGIVFY